MASIAVSSAAAQTASPLPAARLFSWAKDGRFALTVAGIILALNLYAPADPSLLVRVLGSAIILVSAFTIWVWTRGYDPFTAFMPLFAFAYSLHFAVPVFVFLAYIYSIGGEVVSEVYVERALALALAGLLCTLVGYYLVTLTTLREYLPKFKMQWGPQGGLELWAYPLSLLGLVIYLFTETSKAAGTVAEVANLAGGLCIVAILMLFLTQLAGRLSWLGKVYLWGVLLPLRTILGLGSGNLGHATPPLEAMLFAYTLVRRKIPWRIVAIGALGVAALHPFKQSFRTLTWYGGPASNRSLGQKAGLFLDLGETFWQAPPPAELIVTFVFVRLSHITELANIVRETPANVPFWNGHTYYPLFFKLIPRALWQDKPNEETAQAAGHRYNFLAPEDGKTAWAITQLGEFYINFGLPGVVVGMFLMGLIYGCLQACFIHRESGIGAIIGTSYLLVDWFSPETNLSLLFGLLLHEALMLAALNPLLRMRWAAAPAADSP